MLHIVHVPGPGRWCLHGSLTCPKRSAHSSRLTHLAVYLQPQEAATAKLRQFQVAGDADVEDVDLEVEKRLMQERMKARAEKAEEAAASERPRTLRVSVRVWVAGWPWSHISCRNA